MVGLGGLEPPTSPLSGARSSHLSYRPNRIGPINSSTAWQVTRNATLTSVFSLVLCYWTKPTVGGGTSDASLMDPNCDSYRAIFSPNARQMRFAWPGLTIMLFNSFPWAPLGKI